MSLIRHTLRALLNTPAFSAVAILTLAVGLAANTALFSVYDKLILNPVDIPDVGRLVAIWSQNQQANLRAPALSWPKFVEIEKHAKSFSVLAVSTFDTFAITGNGAQPDQLNGLRVSPAFFRALGIIPARGRDFRAEEDVPNGPKVCVLSDALWASRFGRRESIVGDTIQLNNEPWQVVGILPPHVTAPFAQVQVFTPRGFEISQLSPQQVDAGAGFFQAIGRLAPGVTIEQATDELAAISKGYRALDPSRLDADNSALPIDYVTTLAGNLKPTFYTLLAAVGFVLLIACANVSSLFLGRLSGRQKEIAVRQSLGASRAAIVRQFLAESLTFSTIAALVGTMLAFWALKGVEQIFATQLPPNTTFALSWRTWTFLAGIATASAVLVGLAPALSASKPDLVEALKDAARGSSGVRGGRLRATLIVAEVALSVVLLVGSGLLLVSFVRLQNTPPGFDPTGVAAAFVGVPQTRYGTAQQQSDFFQRVVEELRTRPGVSSAAASLGLPIAGFGARSPYSVQGRPILPLPQRPLAGLNAVSADYFSTMKISIVQGRAITAGDREGAPGVCVINHALAMKLFPNESPLGHVLLRGRDANVAAEIVGVIADVKSNGLNAPVPDEVYYSMRQLGKPNMTVIAKTTGDPNALQQTIRAAVTAIDPDQPISFFQTLDTSLAQSLGNQRIVASLTACFAAIALVLAAIGLYAVVAYAVTQRTSEIGIRLALGARPGQVLSLIMRGGLRLIAIGLIIGVAGAAGAAQLMRTLLSNVGPFNPLVYASVASFFVVIASLACLVPSLRASRIDPLAALGDRR